MSTVKFMNLPLGEPSALVDADVELGFARESINWWAQEVMQAADFKSAKDILAARAGTMLLACKFMVLRMAQMLEEDKGMKLSRIEGFSLRKQIDSAVAELHQTSVVKGIFGHDMTHSSLKESVDRARALLKALKASKAKRLDTLPTEKIRAVRRVWWLLSLYQRLDTGSNETITTKEVKNALGWIDKLLPVVKRSNDGDHPEASASQRSKAEDPITDDPIRKRLALLHEVDQKKAKRYLPEWGVVPTKVPLIAAPHHVSVRDMLCLAPGEWLNDIVVDAYMALICHHANGHFQSDPKLPLTPKWMAWNSFTINRLRGKQLGQNQWPPSSYPAAVFGDIERHFFPFCQDNHWMLVVAYQVDGFWQGSLFSSKGGYDAQLDDAWKMVRSHFQYYKTDLSTVRPERPDKPRQDNDADCGVFVLAIVRWAYEQWNLDWLTPDKMIDFRHRVIVEMEDWQLSTN